MSVREEYSLSYSAKQIDELLHKVDNELASLELTATPDTLKSVIKNAKPNSTIQLTPSATPYNIDLTKYRTWTVAEDGSVASIPNGVQYRTNLHTPCYVYSPVKFTTITTNACGSEFEHTVNVGDKLWLDEGKIIELNGTSIKLLEKTRVYSYSNDAYRDLEKGTVLTLAEPIRAAMAYTFANTHPNYKENEVVFLDVDNLPQTNIECVLNPTMSMYNPIDKSTMYIEELVSFPENLTIKGCSGATVSSVTISSGLTNTWYHTRPNLHQSTLSRGLTLDSLELSGNITLRNCSAEDVSIINSHFGTGAGINFKPSNFNVAGSTRYYQAARVKNIVIKNNTFDYATTANTDKAKTNSAIFIDCADGVTISDNVINNAEYNAIQVAGIDIHSGNPKEIWWRYSSKGNITIDSNNIRGTGSRPIRMSWFKDAQVFIVGNYIQNANTIPTEWTGNVNNGCHELIKANYFQATDSTLTVEMNRFVSTTDGVTNTRYLLADEIIIQPTT